MRSRTPMIAVPLLLVLGQAACQKAVRPSSANVPNCAEADAGTLRVTNQSGRMVEIHTWNVESRPTLLGNASPGMTSFPVEGPSNLDVRYAAYDPTRNTMFATVSWIRPHARGGSSMVLLDLECVNTK